MRFLAIALLFLAGASAGAELTCNQLVAISQKTVNLRNDGASLSSVLADLEGPEFKERFTPVELDFIRLLIRESFMGAYSPFDVQEACEGGRLSIPVRKSLPPKK